MVGDPKVPACVLLLAGPRYNEIDLACCAVLLLLSLHHLIIVIMAAGCCYSMPGVGQ